MTGQPGFPGTEERKQRAVSGAPSDPRSCGSIAV